MAERYAEPSAEPLISGGQGGGGAVAERTPSPSPSPGTPRGVRVVFIGKKLDRVWFTSTLQSCLRPLGLPLRARHSSPPPDGRRESLLLCLLSSSTALLDRLVGSLPSLDLLSASGAHG